MSAVLDGLIPAMDLILTPGVLVFLLVGVALGILVGATPGIGPPVGIALILPLTLPLERWEAFALLFSLYIGAMYGGAVSAIILNVPGTPGAIASTFDGYPLSRQGKALYALTISVLASSFGTVIAGVLLIISAPILVSVVLLFGTPEYALIAIFGLTIIPLVSQASTGKSLLAAAFGVLISTIGIAPMTPTPRFALGLFELYDGFAFVALLLGVFAISEMIKLSAFEGSISGESEGYLDEDVDTPVVEHLQDLLDHPVTYIKATLLGLVIGFVPAAGGSVSNIVAYAEEKRSASDSETFGTGNIKGLIASEAANSGTIAGSLVPVLAFGIPGSATSAIILGGLLMHGLQPGPGLFTNDISVSMATFLAIAIGGVFLLLVGLVTVRKASYLTTVDVHLIAPIVIVLCFLGSYALNINYLDVFAAVAAGFLSYLMLKYDYSLVAFIMGLILGPIIEENVHRSFQLGGLDVFVHSPLSTALVVLTLLSLLGPPGRVLYENYVKGAS